MSEFAKRIAVVDDLTHYMEATGRLSRREDSARALLQEAWETIAFTRQPDDAKAVSENRLLAQIEEWLRG